MNASRMAVVGVFAVGDEDENVHTVAVAIAPSDVVQQQPAVVAQIGKLLSLAVKAA